MTGDGRGWSSERLITLIGLLTSIGLAAVVPLAVSTDSQHVRVIAGLAGFITGYMVTMDLSHRSHMRDMEARLMARLDAAEDARFGALPLQRLLSVPEIEDAVRDVVDATANARAKRMQFLANRTIDKVRNDRLEVIRISQGQFSCKNRREELRLLTLALEDSRASVSAVASLGLEAWKTDEFSEYFAIYLDHANGLRQTRFFLITPEEAVDPDMIEILSSHEQAGVETYALNKLVLAPDLCMALVLFDDALLLRHSRPIENDGIEVSFTDDPIQVRNARENVDALLRRVRRGKPGVVFWAPGDRPGTDPIRPAAGALTA